jgi:hypothetical protein
MSRPTTRRIIGASIQLAFGFVATTLLLAALAKVSMPLAWAISGLVALAASAIFILSRAK